MIPEDDAELPFEENPEPHFPDIEPLPVASATIPRWVAVAFGLLTALTIFALVMSGRALKFSHTGIGQLSGETQAAKESAERLSSTLSGRLAQVERENSNLREQVNNLVAELETTSNDAVAARKQALRVRDQARDQIQRLATMNSEIRSQLAGKASVDDVKTVSSDVDSVRGQIASASTDLQTSRGEMGVLIARNHDEIETLRQRGDRDYFEFTLSGKNASEKMGDITITLRGTDAKKNECSFDLFVDDKSTLKRNRDINEPIFFYREREQVPSEIVINTVGKNEIAGYLSIPKRKETLTAVGAN
jgi:hypothetical protein